MEKITSAQMTLDVSTIEFSPFNPRKFIDPAKQTELVESVRQHGVTQAILVRPMPPLSQSKKSFELVCGERRLRAAITVNLASIPASVRNLGDEQVKEIQLVENLQRADLTPIEEAEGYERLIADSTKMTVKEVAAKVGKSETYIRVRLKLYGLTKAGRKAMTECKLSPAIALKVACVLDPARQDKALMEILKGFGMGSPMNLQQASDHIQRNYMLRLRDAPFDTKDKGLNAPAGPCAVCPKNTACDRTLFGDVDAQDSLCTDSICFHKKADEYWENLVVNFDKQGVRVLTDKEAKKIFPGSNTWVSGAYVAFDQECMEDPKRRSWGKLLDKSDAKPSLVRDPRGMPRLVMREADALAALKEAGHKFAKKAERDFEVRETHSNSASRQARKTNVGKRAALLVLAEIATKSEGQINSAFWQLAAGMAVRNARGNVVQLICKRRGLEKSRMVDRDPLVKYLAGLNANQARGLMIEVMCVEYDAYNHYSGGYSDGIKFAAKHYGVDIKKIEKQVSDAYGKRKTAKKEGKK